MRRHILEQVTINEAIERLPLVDNYVRSFNLGIPRKDMPQIPDIVDFSKELANSGVYVSNDTKPAGQLYPTQNEINIVKVEGMVRSGKLAELTSGGVIASGLDNRLVDGHHRWSAAWCFGEDTPLVFISCSAPIHAILDWADTWSGVEYRGVNEATESLLKFRKRVREDVTRNKWKTRR